MADIQSFFGKKLSAVNVGLASFGESMRSQGVEVVDVDFRPPAVSVPRISRTQAGTDIEAANAEAVKRITTGKATVVGLGIARDVVPGMKGKVILHAGPPATWDRMCGPVRGAVMGACLYEGWAKTPDEAVALAKSGEGTFDPCHHHHTGVDR